MWRNYLTITWRSLNRHRAYSFINVFGLAVGMAAGFMILQYVYYETTYDAFFENKENIYRVRTDRFKDGQLSTRWAAGASGAGPDMKDAFPEVLDYVKMYRTNPNMVYGENQFDIEFAFYATANFFEVFSIPLIQGVDSLVLRDMQTAVLSETLAAKMFGSENPVGKEVETHDGARFTVTGVFEDFPEKSHMDAEILFSMVTWITWQGGERADRTWQWDGWLNYVVLEPGTDPAVLESKFPDFIASLHADEFDGRQAEMMGFALQPLDEIHLISDYREEIKTNGDQNATYFLMVIGMFVLVIAWINYINLTTARSLSRAREVGIRKVLGSFKSQLVKQFLFESTFTNLMALVIAIVVVLLVFPYFNDFLGRNTSYSWPEATGFWIGLSAMLLVGILASGFYPSWVLASYRPVTVLKGKFTGSAKGNLLRKGLVIFQFLASIVLITGTYVVYEQLDYLQSQDLGVELEQTLVIESNRDWRDSVSVPRYTRFRSSIADNIAVQQITSSSSVPGRSPNWNAGGIRLLRQTDEEADQYRIVMTDDQFADMYGLEVMAGRTFDRSFGSEGQNVVFNQSALERIGLTNPEDILNEKIFFWGDTFNVIGVIKDYRQESPKTAYDALIFRYSESPGNY
ncbi:MAG: ABC transporter permease, partial [Bacteroidota bacterium]